VKTDLSTGSLAPTEISSLCRAFAEPVRIRILSLLRLGEACVCEIVPVLGLSQSTVSEHLLILKNCGLIEARLQGKWTHYRLKSASLPRISQTLLTETLRACAADAVIVGDCERLEKFRRIGRRSPCDSTQMKGDKDAE
jgi:ArsR family transcriptional regulator